jgi:hypothetical protein
MTWQLTSARWENRRECRDLGADQGGPSAVKREGNRQNKRVLPQWHRGTRGGGGEWVASRHRSREDRTSGAVGEEGGNVFPADPTAFHK